MPTVQEVCDAIWTNSTRTLLTGSPLTPANRIEEICDAAWDNTTRTLTSLEGTVCWGHSTGVTETNKLTFTDHWTGTGVILGTGDAEEIELDDFEYMDSDVVHSGAVEVTIQKNKYGTGDAEVVLKYRHATTVAGVYSASWNTYSAPFTSLGYVQVRVENPPR